MTTTKEEQKSTNPTDDNKDDHDHDHDTNVDEHCNHPNTIVSDNNEVIGTTTSQAMLGSNKEPNNDDNGDDDAGCSDDDEEDEHDDNNDDDDDDGIMRSFIPPPLVTNVTTTATSKSTAIQIDTTMTPKSGLIVDGDDDDIEDYEILPDDEMSDDELLDDDDEHDVDDDVVVVDDMDRNENQRQRRDDGNGITIGSSSMDEYDDDGHPMNTSFDSSMDDDVPTNTGVAGGEDTTTTAAAAATSPPTSPRPDRSGTVNVRDGSNKGSKNVDRTPSSQRRRFPSFGTINPLSPRYVSNRRSTSSSRHSHQSSIHSVTSPRSSSAAVTDNSNNDTTADSSGKGTTTDQAARGTGTLAKDISSKSASNTTGNSNNPIAPSTATATTTDSERPRRGNRLLPMFRKNRSNNDAQKQNDQDLLAEDDHDSSDSDDDDDSSFDGDDDHDDDEDHQWLEGDSQFLFDVDVGEDSDLSLLMKQVEQQQQTAQQQSQTKIDTSALVPKTASDTSTAATSRVKDNRSTDTDTGQVPLSFLGLPPDLYKYLDLKLVRNIDDELDIKTFALEHHLFVRGLLQLLAERDLIGVEEDEVRKVGVLRKKHAKSGWRVKYVEVRKGNLTYFADKENEERRTVHLRKRSCVCRTTSLTSMVNKEGHGEELVFELIVDGGRRLLWMAKSEEECQGWIKAINQAMIGDTDDITDNLPLDLKLYQNAIDVYKAVQTSMRDIENRQECLVAINSLLYSQTSSSALRVPMKWIHEEIGTKNSVDQTTLEGPKVRLRANMKEFWNNLSTTSININGYLIDSSTPFSAERVIGALSRAILEFDKVENSEDFEKMFKSLKKSKQEETDSFITEVEAVAFSRSILGGVLRSVHRDDASTAVNELFRNTSDVVRVELDTSEPLHIDVSFAGDDFSEDEPRPTEVSGWIETKSKKSKKWKLRYFVFSEGVLSYFQWADPRPYGLRGQIVLRDAFVKADGNLLLIEYDDKERELRFEDRAHLVKWKSSMLNNADDSVPASDSIPHHDVTMTSDGTTVRSAVNDETSISTNTTSISYSSSPGRRRTRSVEDLSSPNVKSLNVVREAGAKLKNAADEGVKVISRAKAHANRAAAQGMKRARNATGAGMKSIRSRTGMLMRGVRGTDTMDGNGTRRRPTTDLLMTSTQNIDPSPSGKRDPTVQVVVEWNNVYKVLSKAHCLTDDSTKSNDGKDDKEGDGGIDSTNTSNEVLLIVRVKLYQAFLLSGGPTGRLACGDELLLMEFAKAEGVEDIKNEALEPPTSL